MYLELPSHKTTTTGTVEVPDALELFPTILNYWQRELDVSSLARATARAIDYAQTIGQIQNYYDHDPIHWMFRVPVMGIDDRSPLEMLDIPHPPDPRSDPVSLEFSPYYVIYGGYPIPQPFFVNKQDLSPLTDVNEAIASLFPYFSHALHQPIVLYTFPVEENRRGSGLFSSFSMADDMEATSLENRIDQALRYPTTPSLEGATDALELIRQLCTCAREYCTFLPNPSSDAANNRIIAELADIPIGDMPLELLFLSHANPLSYPYLAQLFAQFPQLQKESPALIVPWQLQFGHTPTQISGWTNYFTEFGMWVSQVATRPTKRSRSTDHGYLTLSQYATTLFNDHITPEFMSTLGSFRELWTSLIKPNSSTDTISELIHIFLFTEYYAHAWMAKKIEDLLTLLNSPVLTRSG